MQKQGDMANSNYKECWWLVQAITGDLGRASLIGSDRYSLEALADFYSHEFRQYFDMTDTKIKKTFSVKIWRLRIKLYFQFGIIILCESFGNHKGNGGYFYYLANPEVLDDPGRSLREYIELLAKYETNLPTKLNFEEVYRKYQNATPSTSMGFISGSSNTFPRMIHGEENLEFVQFAMQFGEVLTIKYGKVKAGVDINDPYSFEPYQVKEIEGRWYAVGNLYPVGHKESAKVAVYDLSRLEFSDAENPDVLFEPVKDFDVDTYINRKLQVDGNHPISCCPVIILTGDAMPDYESDIQIHPLSSAQQYIEDGLFQIYKNLTHDLVVQLGAYGDEFKFSLDTLPEGWPLIIQALNLFRGSEIPKELLHHDHDTYEG